ncbi:MAG: carboxypeptidase regulatory-like domain-containing protein [Anaerolineaceae bacterium]
MSALVRRTSIFLILAALASLAPVTGPAVLATSPCDSVTGDPHPPSLPPIPLISGSILDATTNTGVSGATVNLYRCQGTTAVYVTQLTTNSNGEYSFGSLSQNWYYVVASLTGPLSGKSPATGTINPSSLIGVGTGAQGLSLAFE